MRPPRWLTVFLLATALVASVALWLQRQETAVLRGEIGELREEHRELVSLRAENRRLAATLPPAATLSAWRSDHVAVMRLRGEIEKLQDDLQARERALAK